MIFYFKITLTNLFLFLPKEYSIRLFSSPFGEAEGIKYIFDLSASINGDLVALPTSSNLTNTTTEFLSLTGLVFIWAIEFAFSILSLKIIFRELSLLIPVTIPE